MSSAGTGACVCVWGGPVGSLDPPLLVGEFSAYNEYLMSELLGGPVYDKTSLHSNEHRAERARL